jgi:nitroreductase
MWDFFQTVRHRHSVRKYQQDVAVEDGKLHAILETACSAPSAGDLQSYQVLVVRDANHREALQRAAFDQQFISEAPVCLAFCSDVERCAEKFGERGKNLYALQDATIAAAYAQLAAVAAGLASTWVGYFSEDEVKSVLQIDAKLVPVTLLSIGYAAELPEPTPRRRLEEVVKYL